MSPSPSISARPSRKHVHCVLPGRDESATPRETTVETYDLQLQRMAGLLLEAKTVDELSVACMRFRLLAPQLELERQQLTTVVSFCVQQLPRNSGELAGDDRAMRMLRELSEWCAAVSGFKAEPLVRCRQQLWHGSMPAGVATLQLVPLLRSPSRIVLPYMICRWLPFLQQLPVIAIIVLSGITADYYYHRHTPAPFLVIFCVLLPWLAAFYQYVGRVLLPRKSGILLRVLLMPLQLMVTMPAAALSAAVDLARLSSLWQGLRADFGAGLPMLLRPTTHALLSTSVASSYWMVIHTVTWQSIGALLALVPSICMMVRMATVPVIIIFLLLLWLTAIGVPVWLHAARVHKVSWLHPTQVIAEGRLRGE